MLSSLLPLSSHRGCGSSSFVVFGFLFVFLVHQTRFINVYAFTSTLPFLHDKCCTTNRSCLQAVRWITKNDTGPTALRGENNKRALRIVLRNANFVHDDEDLHDRQQRKIINGDDDRHLPPQRRRSSRRALLSESAALLTSTFMMAIPPGGIMKRKSPIGISPADAVDAPEVRGIAVTPFNGLIFNYRGSDFGGLSASDLNEPSIPYEEFIRKMKSGEVEYVEFMAPNGDAAYAKFKGDAKPIRIGEGYPIEQSDNWSSPTFAIRAVQNAGVPYKFVVPALSSYKTK